MRPAFTDALSGEFQPACDGLGRSHTLARLSRATFLKGVEYGRLGTSTLHYRPSWATLVNVDVTCESEETFPLTTYKLGALGLSSDLRTVSFLNSSSLQSPFDDDVMSIVIRGDGEFTTERFALGLGSEMARAREAVTQTADDFFQQASLL